jgi:hypothetical protein
MTEEHLLAAFGIALAHLTSQHHLMEMGPQLFARVGAVVDVDTVAVADADAEGH